MRFWPTASEDSRFSLLPNLAIAQDGGAKAKQAVAPSHENQTKTSPSAEDATARGR